MDGGDLGHDEEPAGVSYAPAGSGSLEGIILAVGADGAIFAGGDAPAAPVVSVSTNRVCFTGVLELTPLLTANVANPNTTTVDWYRNDDVRRRQPHVSAAGHRPWHL